MEPSFFSAARQGQAEIFQGQHTKGISESRPVGFPDCMRFAFPIKLFLKVHPNCLAFYLLPLSSLAGPSYTPVLVDIVDASAVYPQIEPARSQLRRVRNAETGPRCIHEKNAPTLPHANHVGCGEFM